jgi:hypothetical protein
VLEGRQSYDRGAATGEVDRRAPVSPVPGAPSGRLPSPSFLQSKGGLCLATSSSAAVMPALLPLARARTDPSRILLAA